MSLCEQAWVLYGKRFTLKLMMFAALACLAIVTSAPAIAATVISTPAGLNPGDTFRIVFCTTDRFPSYSQYLSHYDALVTAQADGATYDGQLISWQVIGSTGYVQAIADPPSPEVFPVSATTHIGVNPSLAGLFRVDGVKVTTGDGPTGLWSGGLLEPINRDIYGTEQMGLVFTGTATNGSAYGFQEGLGNFAPIIGAVQNTAATWVNGETGDYQYNQNRFYGISEVLTVPALVPEPTSALLLALGALTVIGAARQKR